MLTVPLEAVRAEYQAGNSRFIACLSPCDSVEAARAYLHGIRREFADASHHVPAFIIGGGNTVHEFCSDDGEPSGTAGRPALTVLKGSGLGNLCLVIVRYFGGTLLGTGGLVKAYTEAAQHALALVRRAAIVPVHSLELELPYHLYERCRQEIDRHKGELTAEAFGESVRLKLELASEQLAAFQLRLAELSSGQLQAQVTGNSLRRLALD